MAALPASPPLPERGIVIRMRDLIAGLGEARRRFGPGAAREKLALLAAAARQPRVPAPWRLTWHDELLFCLTYPDNAAVRRAAERELARLADQIAGQPPEAVRTLANSGVAGTWVTTSYSPDLLRWLLVRPGASPELVWEDGAAPEGLEAALSLLALPVESDGLLHPGYSTEEWVGLASGPRDTLAWLLDRVDALHLPPDLRERLFATLGVEVRWRLSRDGRTFTRFPRRRIHYQRRPLDREVPLGEVLAAPLPPPASLDRKAVLDLIDVARTALAARGRETDPITWANPAETVLFHLDRGIDVALFGLLPEHRLPIESYFGFMAARNRIPIAYGGGWIFFGRGEIGVNLFEEFRGGESAYLFAQVLRTYRQHFRVRQFQVDPFQFGLGNSEAIRSGAYWFYHRLGFRLIDDRLRAVAGAEYHRIRTEPGYRSPAPLLRRLTGSRLYLDVDTAEQGGSPDLDPWRPVAPDLAEVSLAVTRWVAGQHGGNRERAGRMAERQAARWLGLGGGLTVTERQWIARLAPVAAMIPGLAAWSERDRLALGRILRAKGGRRERDYALALQRHRRLEAGLYSVTAASS